MKSENRDESGIIKGLAADSPLFWQSSVSRIATTILIIFLMLTHSSVNAEGFSLILNGKSFHKEQPKKGKFNEKNWGLGLQYDYSIYNKHWQPYLTVSGFKDSFERNSFYAGGGILRRFSLTNLYEELYFDVGMIAFVMSRKDYYDRRPFLGALPAFTFGTDKVALNISYVPKVEPKLVPLWFVQLKVAFNNFDD